MYLATTLCVILVIANAEEICTPPQELTSNEGRCLELETTFFERVQHEAKGLFASAKRKLGIDPNAQQEPLNCSYYACLLQGLGMSNSNGTLVLEEIKNWLNKNIPNEYKDEFTLHATKCFENNAKNESNETYCDLSADYMKCLHNFEKCQIIKYP
ncbi:PBP/GOBP family [Popillia japonica]|uniref:PBP/GOBP family n=1 Tax=Popillia japonica TaxID=7064 RepID=A0AAW1JFG0_POPJA